ncbi:MAG: hypothetical protein FWG87_01750 [Defluviitaleaceae bacterium]|nr:hypothetical protein [Defluviitaleaceae bacterium]
MHLMDSLFRWLIDQAVSAIDMFGMSILSVLGADLTLFVNIFPIVETTYEIFVVTALTLLGLNMMWGIFKNFFLPIGIESEPPFSLAAKTVMFGFLAFFALDIAGIAINLANTPYQAILGVDEPAPEFVRTHAIMTIILVGGGNGVLIGLLLALIFVVIVGWNYFKLIVECVERYFVVGILAFTSPLAFAMGASQATSPIFKSWCRMLGGQLLLLVMNVWTLRMFITMLRVFIANPVMSFA